MNGDLRERGFKVQLGILDVDGFPIALACPTNGPRAIVEAHPLAAIASGRPVNVGVVAELVPDKLGVDGAKANHQASTTVTQDVVQLVGCVVEDARRIIRIRLSINADPSGEGR